MQRLYDQEEYQHIISELADEFAASIDNGCALDVATGVMVSYIDLGTMEHTVTVSSVAEVNGGSVQALDNEPLVPYDIITYSEQYPRHVFSRSTADTASMVAAHMLAMDLNDERNYRDGWA